MGLSCKFSLKPIQWYYKPSSYWGAPMTMEAVGFPSHGTLVSSTLGQASLGSDPHQHQPSFAPALPSQRFSGTIFSPEPDFDGRNHGKNPLGHFEPWEIQHFQWLIYHLGWLFVRQTPSHGTFWAMVIPFRFPMWFHQQPSVFRIPCPYFSIDLAVCWGTRNNWIRWGGVNFTGWITIEHAKNQRTWSCWGEKVHLGIFRILQMNSNDTNSSKVYQHFQSTFRLGIRIKGISEVPWWPGPFWRCFPLPMSSANSKVGSRWPWPWRWFCQKFCHFPSENVVGHFFCGKKRSWWHELKVRLIFRSKISEFWHSIQTLGRSSIPHDIFLVGLFCYPLFFEPFTIWLFNIAMENHHFK